MAKDGLISKLTGATLVGILPMALAAVAQAQQAASSQAPAAAPPVIASSPSVDILPLHAFVGGVPLRHGNLVPGSDSLQLNDRQLNPATDYAIDYVAGVIYLKVPQQVGDTLTASYRYTSGPAASAVNSAPAFNGLQIGFMPGATALLGFGLAEREVDGSASTSNLFGWHNDLKFGKSSGLTGTFLMADQQQAQVANGFTMIRAGVPRSGLASGTSQRAFLVQQFRSSMMGGSMTLDMQDVNRGFSNFNEVRAAGYTDDDVKRFTSERGLSRMGMDFQGLRFGNLAVSDSFKQVSDGTSKISWRTVGLQQGAFKLNYSDRQIDQNFSRANDLSDADKAQLAKEVGLSRRDFASEFAEKAGKLSFTSQQVTEDATHSAINKQDLAYGSKKYNLEFGRENVDQGFGRLSSLTTTESSTWTRELGLKRQWLATNAALDAKTNLTFNQTQLGGDTGAFQERDAAFTGKTLSLQHIDLHSTTGFTGLSGLQDADVTKDLAKIAPSYGDKITPAAGDKSALLATAGIQRDYNLFNWQFKKDWAARFDDDQFKGASDGASVRNLSLTGKTLTASFRTENVGQNFTEVGSLMPMETSHLGTLTGLKRQDISFADQFTKISKLQFSSLNADTPTGGAHRTLFDYTNNGIEISGAERKVDTNFTGAGQLVDPEAGVLGALAGFQQSDVKWNLTRFKNFKFSGEAQDARDEATGETRGLKTAAFSWNLDKNTAFAFNDTAQSDNQPLSAILDTETEQYSLTHNFGRFGKVQLQHELDVDRGTNSTVPGQTSDLVSYQTQITKATSFTAEETLASATNGEHASIASETLSTQLTKRAGVSFTEVEEQGNIQGQDASKNNYGVWYDLGNGVRISYGYAHQLVNGTDTVTNDLTVAKNPTAPTANQYNTLQGGALGPLTFAGGYGTNQYSNIAGAANHNQAFSNVSLATAKPMKWGPLTNVKLSYGMDTAADYGSWSKDNHKGSFSANIGHNTFGFDYNAQLASQGLQGIDRSVNFQTDQSPKSWLKATMLYKVRTLPGEQSYVIRNYNIDAKPMKNLEISNLLQTNPEVANTSVFLGSIPQAARSDKWAVDYHQGADTTFGLSYQELINEANDLRATTSGINLKLFQKSGSPVTLFYGSEDDLGGDLPHRSNARYNIEFDQKAGPHQAFSLFLGNVSYDFNPNPAIRPNNWTARLDYSIHF